MRFSVFTSTAIFASALASPLIERIERRAGKDRGGPGSLPIIVLSENIALSSLGGQLNGVAANTESKHIVYSSNWAGGVLTAAPAKSQFKSVYGVFTVPTPVAPRGSTSGSYSTSIWVGIDGDTAQQSIWQAGIDITATVTTTKGKTTTSYSYDSWYEWYPHYAIDFSTGQFSFTAGNQISLNITATSASTGIAILKNLSTGKSVTQSVVSPSSSANLVGANAEWIVEDYASGGSLVPFANFGNLTFTQCVAGYSAANAWAKQTGTMGTTNAQLLALVNSANTVITKVSIPSANSINLIYTGK